MPDPCSEAGPDPQIDIDPRLAVLRHLSTPVWIYDVDTQRILWANAAGLTFWNARSSTELLDRDLSDISPQVGRRLEQYRTDCARLGRSFREHWTLYPNGEPLSAEIVVAPFALPDDRVALLLNVDQSVAGVEDSASLHGVQALMHTSAMIALYDRHWSTLYLNASARATEPTGMEGFPDRLLDPEALAGIEDMLEREAECAIELDVRTAAGKARHAMTIRRGRSPISGDEMRVVTAIDVTLRHAAEREVQRLAFTDPLTGLANRTELTRDIERRLQRDDRNIEPPGFALLFLDLDRFKLVNDSLGHSTGDALLVQVARRLQRIAADGATVARLGGDEFVILDEVGTGVEGATRLAQAILDAMEAVFVVHGHRLRIGPSIGISLSPTQGTSAEELMRHADIAMYVAKSAKSGFATFDVYMNSDARQRLEIENGLVRALERNRFEVHYQPKVRCDTGEAVSFEALVRWRDPQRGLVPPLEFIAIAEDTGLILRIGQRVMLESMRQQRAWSDAGHPLGMSINVSARQFGAGDLLENVIECLEQTGADPEMIELEITESVLLGDAERVADTLRSITELGVAIAIDDFGTGYSNLAYLQRYPLDCLKIDRAFVADPAQSDLLELILGIGRTLGLTTVAEGVETLEQARWLSERGCDQIQGFFYARPMTSEKALDWVKGRQPGVTNAA